MFAHVAERADALVAAFVFVIDARRAKTATRPPSAFVHVVATAAVFRLTSGTTKREKYRRSRMIN